jgi:hypothetical protein
MMLTELAERPVVDDPTLAQDHGASMIRARADLVQDDEGGGSVVTNAARDRQGSADA